MNTFNRFLKYALIMGAMAAFTTACSDDDNPTPMPEVKLLPSVVKGEDYERTFYYDTQNRIIHITDIFDDTEHGTTDVTHTAITYDGDKVSAFIQENSSYYVTYEGDLIYLNKGTENELVLTFENELLTKVEQDSKVRTTYVYDSEKNLKTAKYAYYGTLLFEYNYTYDTTKQGIFINSATPNWVMVFLEYGYLHSPNLVSSRGEIVKSGNNSNYDLSIADWSDYKDGFPTKLTETGTSYQTTTTISYISN